MAWVDADDLAFQGTGRSGFFFHRRCDFGIFLLGHCLGVFDFRIGFGVLAFGGGFLVGLFRTGHWDVHHQAVGLALLAVGLQGKDADVIDALCLRERHVQIGVTIFFGNCGEINGSGVHVILGFGFPHGCVFQDQYEILSAAVHGSLGMHGAG